MKKQRKRIINTTLIIIIIVLIVSIVKVSSMLYFSLVPSGYQKIISKYNSESSTNNYYEFIRDYQDYVKKINTYNFGVDCEYVTGKHIKFSKKFFDDNDLLVIHLFGNESTNMYGRILSYRGRPNRMEVGIDKDDNVYNEKTENKIEYIYIVPVDNDTARVDIIYPCSDMTDTIIGNAIPIAIIFALDAIIIGYIITEKKIFKGIVLVVLCVFILIGGVLYLIEASHPSISEKPIIYLYPEEDTQVNVRLGNEENISCSYPTYSHDGWNVLAKPTGNLIDLDTGRNLYSLYYECDNVVCFTTKNDGFVVESNELVEFLEEKLSILGLTEREAEEFIVYWLPRLQANKYNYIRFATMDEINQNMPLEFSTNPDTLIRVLMTYKPLKKPVEVEEQQLNTPERKGFVAVEWGGIQIQ